MEIEGVERFGERGLVIRTREFWRSDFFWVTGGVAPEQTRSYIIRGRYLLLHEDSGWTVDAWDLDERAAETGDDPS
jgi:hypothetical protein